MANKQFVIIGLGIFGSSMARTLYSLGNDVLAIDKNENLVQKIADEVTQAVVLDATDENALKSLGINNFDVAVVTIGENIQSSIMATILVKELGAKYIISKAKNDLHGKVLKKIGADRVVLPEKEMAIRIAHNLVSSNILDYIELSSDYTIVEIQVPDKWIDKSLKDIKLRSKYGINVIAIKRKEKLVISPLGEDKLLENDIIISIIQSEDLEKLEAMNLK
ncbi:MAG: TrkA family potassium uptake protein [Clostridiales bacterium]|nr:TrkA family potassium uptake protein [Clostridiales bacterium]